MTACDFERSEESLFRLEPINNFGCLVQEKGPRGRHGPVAPSAFDRSGLFLGELALLQRINHSDERIDLNRPSVEICGLVAPLLHGFQRGSHKKWIAVNDLERLYAAIRRDDCVQFHLTALVKLVRKMRIDRLHPSNQQSGINFCDVDAIAPRGSFRLRGLGSRVEDIANR